MGWRPGQFAANRGLLLHCRTGRQPAWLAGFRYCGPWLPRCCHSGESGNPGSLLARCGWTKPLGSGFRGNDAEPFMTDPQLEDLRRNIPGLRLETGPAELEHFGRDWTRRWTPAPLAIALPSDVGQVQDVVRWAAANGVAIVRAGGRPGLA